MNNQQVISAMISANAPMVFWYKSSKPTLERHVYPIEIIVTNGVNRVVCVEVLTGKYKSFFIDHISFNKISKIYKRHAFDCGNEWNFEIDVCNCGGFGATRVSYEIQTKDGIRLEKTNEYW